MGMWINEHKQGEGFRLTKILLAVAVGWILLKGVKKNGSK